MPKNLKEQIDRLIKLQDIEINIFNIKTEIEKAPERLASLDASIKTREEEIEKESSLLDELIRQLRGYENESKDNVSKIKKSNERLASIKTNKEYQAVLKEIDDLNSINLKVEDKILEYLEQIDDVKKQIKDRKDELVSLSKSVLAEKENVIKESEAGHKTLGELGIKRNELLKKIESSALEKFNMVKSRKGQIAIVRAKDSVCLGCNMNMPPQKYN